MSISHEERTDLILERIGRIESRVRTLEGLVGSLMLSILAFNLMLEPIVDKKVKEKAIKKAAEQLGKFKALSEVSPTSPSVLFKRYGEMKEGK